VDKVAVGQINHDKIYEEDNSAELDIWLRSSEYINKGYGTDAICTLCNYLHREFNCRRFILCPSARNSRAIKAYEKAGFVITNEKPDTSSCDYRDNIMMVKEIV
jgi:RimJ/RimL family protein N-acetyltransferase